MVKSTFKKGAEGWTVVGDPETVEWREKGGDGNGYLSWSDAQQGDICYFAAPKKFEGAKGGYFGGRLSYEVYDVANDYADAPDVVIRGANGVTLVAVVGQAGSGWTPMSIALDASGGWRLETTTGEIASDRDIRAVLKSISDLEIRAEYTATAVPEIGGLDNVVMAKPPSASAFGADSAAIHIADTEPFLAHQAVDLPLA